MPRPISARIHRDSIRRKLAFVRRTAASSRVWAVIKANAYGHGIERIYPARAQADGSRCSISTKPCACVNLL